MTVFFREERAHLETRLEQQEAKLEQQRADAEAQRRALEARMEQLREQAKPQQARDAISEAQLEALQSRLEALHEASLLTDEELNSLEDVVVDCIEVLPTAFAMESKVEAVVKMILVRENVVSRFSFPPKHTLPLHPRLEEGCGVVFVRWCNGVSSSAEFCVNTKHGISMLCACSFGVVRYNLFYV